MTLSRYRYTVTVTDRYLALLNVANITERYQRYKRYRTLHRDFFGWKFTLDGQK
jgi:hypothetical protein